MSSTHVCLCLGKETVYRAVALQRPSALVPLSAVMSSLVAHYEVWTVAVMIAVLWDATMRRRPVHMLRPCAEC
jgi:hypothetical protein